jgi:hypothetical protein
LIARRSCLSVPATQPRFFEKADQSAADLVFFDLADSVPPSEDLAAVVGAAGGSVLAFGHSSGGALVLEASR